MKRHKIPESHVTHPNVTPLIDVVMCLIIFYMLVARIGVKTGADQQIDLPTSFQGIKLTDLGNTVTLNVRAGMTDQPVVTMLNPLTGTDESVLIVQGEKEPLRAFLTMLKGGNKQFKVIIRADQDLDYRFLEPVLVACFKAQVKDVNFATRKADAAKSAQ